MEYIVIAIIIGVIISEAVKRGEARRRDEEIARIKAEQRRKAEAEKQMRDEWRKQEAEAQRLAREQIAMKREQERIAREQERQAAQLAKHEEQIMRLEDRMNTAENELAFNREQRGRLFQLLDIAERERDAAIEGSGTWEKYQKKVIALENQIHTVQKRIDKANQDKRFCERKLSA